MVFAVSLPVTHFCALIYRRCRGTKVILNSKARLLDVFVVISLYIYISWKVIIITDSFLFLSIALKLFLNWVVDAAKMPSYLLSKIFIPPPHSSCIHISSGKLSLSLYAATSLSSSLYASFSHFQLLSCFRPSHCIFIPRP